ncbi:hypothetical protein O6H91_05G110400 [Diphasiastrum complanatum]|uniref:Uncharacterized protein n=1 Tax=Diphasiastrum complanatum TaxID=34168 RepID=A0ACC2DS75_DIPCM|nr:hypothetical protein O6H91_Y056600 [Diphasiastrum complanatum]KAJ7557064.1 hypothetical protein O6H91_05G110400 [Diphasiastrum complanatum]
MEAWGDDFLEHVDGGRGRSGASLAVNKSSSKIAKGMRKPLVQPKPVPPKVYNTDPTSFRNLVQELTGTAAGPSSVVVSSSLSSTSSSSVSRPASTRLQKIAPPPLKTFPFSGMAQQSLPPLSPTSPKLNPNSFNNAASSFPKMLSPIPILSPHTFSPLPVLTPSDGMWPNPLDSPDTVALRRLAEKMVESENARPNMNAGPDAASSFPWSSAMQACFGLASPGSGLGMAQGHALGNIYVGLGVNDSPSAHSMKDFSFPNPDYVSGFS